MCGRICSTAFWRQFEEYLKPACNEPGMPPHPTQTDTLCAHLRACEEALLDPAVRRIARVAAFLAEDFQEFGSSGQVWSREQILELLATEDYHRRWKISSAIGLGRGGACDLSNGADRSATQGQSAAACCAVQLWIKESEEVGGYGSIRGRRKSKPGVQLVAAEEVVLFARGSSSIPGSRPEEQPRLP
jgi:hypothetical protein